MKYSIAIVFAIGALGFSANAAEEKKEQPKPAPTQEKITKQQISYAVGMNIGNQWKQNKYDFDPDEVAKAIKDILSGGATKMTEAQAQGMVQQWRTEVEAERKEAAKKQGAAFLSENVKKPGVKVTDTGLQYKVLTEGTGKTPTAKDKVRVHYVGKLLDGTEFDSSRKRGQPAEFGVSGVIKGWTEALQLMKEGSKWELYIPSELAYGEMGQRTIPPNSVLTFEIELLEVKTAEESVQAVSGEVIRVPSAEEISKGAKIEVLKEEDVKKLQEKNKAAETNKPAATPAKPTKP
jgi:FKBP-type peptidyl-prolyl cis-trans isomerase